MPTASITYKGNLRTKSIHNLSDSELFTDAPIDNNGKGEGFSPTDLIVTGLGACVLTIIGIYSSTINEKFTQGNIEIDKIMSSKPRRISAINLTLNIKGNDWDKKTTSKIINAAKNCPVFYSLNPDIDIKWKIVS